HLQLQTLYRSQLRTCTAWAAAGCANAAPQFSSRHLAAGLAAGVYTFWEDSKLELNMAPVCKPRYRHVRSTHQDGRHRAEMPVLGLDPAPAWSTASNSRELSPVDARR
ncbi:hypothetical protein CABS01_10893, partial [Colletotrichum abscissum]|uniref:uncharacterized protein n=1 Tax=Colletotrichum abscissum TaxID=1671311 RepID=UPI0027D4CCB0